MSDPNGFLQWIGPDYQQFDGITTRKESVVEWYRRGGMDIFIRVKTYSEFTMTLEENKGLSTSLPIRSRLSFSRCPLQDIEPYMGGGNRVSVPSLRAWGIDDEIAELHRIDDEMNP